jgi:hypothetical protein
MKLLKKWIKLNYIIELNNLIYFNYRIYFFFKKIKNKNKNKNENKNKNKKIKWFKQKLIYLIKKNFLNIYYRYAFKKETYNRIA